MSNYEDNGRTAIKWDFILWFCLVSGVLIIKIKLSDTKT